MKIMMHPDAADALSPLFQMDIVKINCDSFSAAYQLTLLSDLV
jgi:hypothetical protein